jgi:hypothetical protein
LTRPGILGSLLLLLISTSLVRRSTCRTRNKLCSPAPQTELLPRPPRARSALPRARCFERASAACARACAR